MIRILKLLLIFFLITEANLHAEYQFKKLNLDIGLNFVKSIYRDHEDYLWIGSLGTGLVRYDGYNTKNFQYSADDSTSLSDNNIRYIYEDQNNTLWIATKNGLNRFVRGSDSFVQYYTNSKVSSSIGISSNNVYKIIESDNSELWVLTDAGLNLYDRKKDRYTSYSPHEKNYLNGFRNITKDKDGNFWCSGYFPGIYKFNIKTREFDFFIFKQLHGSSNSTATILADSDGIIWVGFYGLGLYRFNPKNNETVHIPASNDTYGTNGLYFSSMVQLNDSILLFGVDQGGINEYNKKSRRFSYITSNDLNYGQLSSDGIFSLYVDKEGIIWVGMTRGGISYYNNKLIQFRSFSSSDKCYGNNDKSISTGIVGCFLQDKDSVIWIGTDGGGINIFDLKNKTFKTINKQNHNLSSNVIRSIQEDKNGNIWILSWDGAIVSYNKKTKKFQSHKFINKKLTDENDRYWSMLIDSKNRFWITHPIGLVNIFDDKENLKRSFFDTNDDSRIASSPLVYESPYAEIFICNYDGLYKYNESDHSMEICFKIKNPGYVTVDSDSTIWITSTKEGLFHLTKEGNLIKQYTKNDGLADNYLCAVGTDNKFVWCSTNNGLSMLNKKTGKFLTFTEKDGLPSNQFFEQSYMKTSNGKHFFGTTNGFIYFQPDKIQLNNFIPPVYISDIYISGKKANLYKNAFARKDTVIIDWEKDILISLNFLSISYSDPNNNQYAYILKGLEKSWNFTNAYQRKATYTNLDPGTYVFKVRASNNNGIWNNEGASLTIIIPVPFWKRPIVYIVISLLILFLAVLSVYARQRKILADRKKLEEKVKERTKVIEDQHHELEAQRDELFLHHNRLEKLVEQRTKDLVLAKKKAEESDQLKTYFLANMSHEIRTPMNAIIGFSTLLDTPDLSEKEKKEYTSLIVSNSEALLYLIEDILDSSLIESNQLKIHNSIINLNNLIDNIYDSFSLRHHSESVKLILNNAVEEEHLFINSDEYRIKQIINNLIGNALKFTTQGSIEIGIRKNNAHLELFVKDTGKGISKENLESIFNQFVKLEEDQLKAKRGVGLGLAISKRLAVLLDGELTVSSEKGIGSEFVLFLPLTKVVVK